MATCPECDGEIEVAADDLEEMEIGDPWDCAECASRLRVSLLDPLEFDPDDEDDDRDESSSSGASSDSDDSSLDNGDDDDTDDEDWDD